MYRNHAPILGPVWIRRLHLQERAIEGETLSVVVAKLLINIPEMQ